MNITKSMIFLVTALIILGGAILIVWNQKPEPAKNDSTFPAEELLEVQNETKAPEMELKEGATYSAVLHTDKGDITISLFADKTPVTANNFISLSRKKFYDNTVFHRIVKGFMIQGGDPSGDGTGGPGYRFADEPFDGEYTRGAVAMANAGPDTNGSQFFIMHADYPLPKDYVIFGMVTSGMEVVDTIAQSDVTANPGNPTELSKPVKPPVITSVEIIEKQANQ